MAKLSLWSSMGPKIFDEKEAAGRITGIAIGNYEEEHTRDHYDAAYFRNEAAMLREEPYLHCNRDYMDASDCDNPTADDLEETADEIECGFEGGEFI